MKKLIFALVALSALSAHAQLDEAGQACGAYTQMRTTREADLQDSLKSIATLAGEAAREEQDASKRDKTLGKIVAEAKKISNLRKEIKELGQAQSEYCE